MLMYWLYSGGMLLSLHGLMTVIPLLHWLRRGGCK